jgi:hypothetical protein
LQNSRYLVVHPNLSSSSSSASVQSQSSTSSNGPTIASETAEMLAEINRNVNKEKIRIYQNFQGEMINVTKQECEKDLTWFPGCNNSMRTIFYTPPPQGWILPQQQQQQQQSFNQYLRKEESSQLPVERQQEVDQPSSKQKGNGQDQQHNVLFHFPNIRLKT